MNIDDAARSLEERFRQASWFTAVGIGEHAGEPALFLYVKNLRNVDQTIRRDGWEGFRVEIRKMGTPKLMRTG
jgi:hypothetical protein